MHEIELEPEVADWLRGLDDRAFGQAAFALDLLAAEGPLLAFPYSSQLRGRLRELRVWVEGRRFGVTYFMTNERRIVMLTVFAKSQSRERREIDRAESAMHRCLDERHIAEDDR